MRASYGSDCTSCLRHAALQSQQGGNHHQQTRKRSFRHHFTHRAPPSHAPCAARAAADVEGTGVDTASTSSPSSNGSSTPAASQATAVNTPIDGSNSPTAARWELDFCSRPLLDVRGKKVWELLICDQEGQWVHSQYFPNNKINSTELKAVLKDLLAQEGAVKPERVLFFRSQMQTIISRALDDLLIEARPSRRCYSLIDLLQQRKEEVYTRDERYSESAGTLFKLDLAPPEEISDALRGEQWAFVQLPLRNLKAEMEGLKENRLWGRSLPNLGTLKVTDDTMVPGVAIFSRRARPLAAWTNSLEMACIKADIDRSCLMLETGVRDRYRYGAWRPTQEADQEAENWEKAKEESDGLHFMAQQTHADAEECTGIWMLREPVMPDV